MFISLPDLFSENWSGHDSVTIDILKNNSKQYGKLRAEESENAIYFCTTLDPSAKMGTGRLLQRIEVIWRRASRVFAPR